MSIIFCTLDLILVKGRMSVLKITFRAVTNSIHCKMGFLMEVNMLPNSSSASQKGRPTVIPYDGVTGQSTQSAGLSVICYIYLVLNDLKLTSS